jgi:hypothetical protein
MRIGEDDKPYRRVETDLRWRENSVRIPYTIKKDLSTLRKS